MTRKFSDNVFLPAWLTVRGASEYSGLSDSLIYCHLQDGSLVSSTVKRPGCRRGRRLIQRESLDQLIESGIGLDSDDNTRGPSID